MRTNSAPKSWRSERPGAARDGAVARLVLLCLGGLLGVFGRDVDLGRLAQALAEGLHALPHAPHDLGEATGAEDDEDDDEYDQ